MSLRHRGGSTQSSSTVPRTQQKSKLTDTVTNNFKRLSESSTTTTTLRKSKRPSSSVPASRNSNRGRRCCLVVKDYPNSLGLILRWGRKCDRIILRCFDLIVARWFRRPLIYVTAFFWSVMFSTYVFLYGVNVTVTDSLPGVRTLSSSLGWDNSDISHRNPPEGRAMALFFSWMVGG